MEAPERMPLVMDERAAMFDFSWTATTLNLIPGLSWDRSLTSSALEHQLERYHAITVGFGLFVEENVAELKARVGNSDAFREKVRKARQSSPKKIDKSADAILKLSHGQIDAETAIDEVKKNVWNSDTNAKNSFLWLEQPTGNIDIPRIHRLAQAVEASLNRHHLPSGDAIREAVEDVVQGAKLYLDRENEHKRTYVATVQLRFKLAVARAVVEYARDLTPTPNVTDHRSHLGSATVYDPLSREEREAAMDREHQALMKLDQSREAIKMIPQMDSGTHQRVSAELSFREALQVRYRLILGSELLVNDDVAIAEEQQRIHPKDAHKLRSELHKTEKTLAEYNGRLNDGRSNEEDALTQFNALIWPANQRGLRVFEELTATEAEIQEKQFDVARLRAATTTVESLLRAFRLRPQAEVGVCKAVFDVIQRVDGYLDKAQFSDVDTLELQFLINIARYVVN